jgi:hypothetical protein
MGKATHGQIQVDYEDWNYEASCTLTSLPVWDSENFKRFIFVADSVQKSGPNQNQQNLTKTEPQETGFFLLQAGSVLYRYCTFLQLHTSCAVLYFFMLYKWKPQV